MHRSIVTGGPHCCLSAICKLLCADVFGYSSDARLHHSMRCGSHGTCLLLLPRTSPQRLHNPCHKSSLSVSQADAECVSDVNIGVFLLQWLTITQAVPDRDCFPVIPLERTRRGDGSANGCQHPEGGNINGSFLQSQGRARHI